MGASASDVPPSFLLFPLFSFFLSRLPFIRQLTRDVRNGITAPPRRKRRDDLDSLTEDKLQSMPRRGRKALIFSPLSPPPAFLHSFVGKISARGKTDFHFSTEGGRFERLADNFRNVSHFLFQTIKKETAFSSEEAQRKMNR